MLVGRYIDSRTGVESCTQEPFPSSRDGLLLHRRVHRDLVEEVHLFELVDVAWPFLRTSTFQPRGCSLHLVVFQRICGDTGRAACHWR